MGGDVKEPLRGELEPAPDGRPAFTAESGQVAARAKAQQAKLLREARRQAVEEYLAGRMSTALQLLVSQVEAAEAEQKSADDWNRKVTDLVASAGADPSAVERRTPDKDVMSRGMRAAETIIERLVGKVASKVEGSVEHQHFFEVLDEARKQRQAQLREGS